MPNQKRLIIAIGLSIIIMVAWNFLFPHKPPVLPDENNNPLNSIEVEQTLPTEKKPTALRARTVVLNESPRLVIDSPKIKGSINLKGLRWDDLTLLQYRQTLDANSPAVVLLSPRGTEQAYVMQLGFLARDPNLQLPNNNTIWSSNKRVLKNNDEVVLTTQMGGLVYKVTVRLDNDYLFTVTPSIQNFSAVNQDMSFYGLTARFGEPPLDPLSNIIHHGALGMIDQNLVEKSYKNLRKENFMAETQKGWIGWTDKYWLTSMIFNNSDQTPEPNNSNELTAGANNFRDNNIITHMSYSEVDGLARYQTDFATSYETLSRRQTLEKTFYIFAGPKEIGLINHYAKTKAIERFDLAIDYGVLYFFTKPMAWLLHYFSTLFGSVGLAIIALTIVVRLLLFPLAQKSFRSMAMMKELQPEVDEIKKRHKSNNAELSKAMMGLYKKRGVNPLAGCLPMLIQIPVFFALYKVFVVAIEFRHTPFFGWIKDISAPDPYGLLTGFGLFSWQVPHLLYIFNIGIWPIIMGVTLWLQQKLSPTVTDPIQQKIFKVFPFLFAFMLGQSPAGLVIYWSWNNILSIIQQYIINRQISGKKTLKPAT